MKTIISYSHNNSPQLDIFHSHLAQLKREGLIGTWTDREIQAGGLIDENIFKALENSALFCALLSPDYIASNYCYETEFKKALEIQALNRIIIVPIILEPCDWLNTPFKAFKALPKDGKPISTWANVNTAFLDVIQNLRRLAESGSEEIKGFQTAPAASHTLSKNYRVQKDFDSIEKMEFIEKTFNQVKDFLKRYIDEIMQLDNIKARIVKENSGAFEYILVNRNKINTESLLKISIKTETRNAHYYSPSESDFNYSITDKNHSNVSGKGFTLSYDEYHLFWKENNFFGGTRINKELDSKDIADIVWGEWLKSVGIME